MKGIHLDITQSYWEVDGPKTWLISGGISEEQIKVFAGKIGKSFRKIVK
jgi:hypothetical protein